MTDNITRCTTCGGSYISEEYETHVCCKELAVTIILPDGKRLGSYDGINFFKLPSFRPANRQLTGRTDQPKSDQNLIKGTV